MKWLFDIKDITTPSSLKEKRDLAEYIRELKKVKLKRDNTGFEYIKQHLNTARYNYKNKKRIYQINLVIPKKYKRLFSGSISRNTNVVTTKLKQVLISEFKNNIRNARFVNKELTSDIISTIKSDHIYYSSSMKEFIKDYPTIGKVRLEEGLYLRLNKSIKILKWFENKKPLNNQRHIGVELECYMYISREDFAIEMNKQAPDLVTKVTIKDDGSLHGHEDESGKEAFEICIVDNEKDINNTIERVLNICSQHDITIEKDCGMHVHLDMRKRDKHLSLTNLSRFQNLLYKLTDKDRRKNKFCKPIRVVDAETYFHKIYYNRNNEARYKGINVKALQAHSTIEIRIHAGCSSYERITSWINLLIKIVDAKGLPSKVPTSVKKIGALLDLDNNMLQYVKKYSRIKKIPKQDQWSVNGEIPF